jgi:hypothetical protein
MEGLKLDEIEFNENGALVSAIFNKRRYCLGFF